MKSQKECKNNIMNHKHQIRNSDDDDKENTTPRRRRRNTSARLLVADEQAHLSLSPPSVDSSKSLTSPAMIDLLSPIASLFLLTPPAPSLDKRHQTVLTPPPNSEKLALAIKLVESTLDEAIEDVRRVISSQDEEEEMQRRRLARKDSVPSASSRTSGDTAATLSMFRRSSLLILSSERPQQLQREEDEENFVISKPTRTAASRYRRRILDDDSSRDSSCTLSTANNHEDQDEDDETMSKEEEEETIKDNTLGDGLADLKITDKIERRDDLYTHHDNDESVFSDVSFGQNNQYDFTFDDEQQESEEEEEEMNDEDSFATANIVPSSNNEGNNDDNDDESILCFEGCGCWSLNNETGDLYLSSFTEENDDTIGRTNERKSKWPNLRLPLPLYNKLYQHQRIGVQWMASLHHNDIKGGILADDMGLGKTMSTLTYLGSLMRAETISNAIIICPKSVVRSWEREANLILKNMCVPNATVSPVTSDMGKEKRVRIFEDAFCSSSIRPCLVITTYGLVSNHITDLTSISNTYDEYRWCYIVLDEGHQIKNASTKMSKDVRILASRSPLTRRLLLTGTPIQNSMKELHTLFDWACGGKLLGSLKTFLNQFGIPIEEGRQKNASQWTVKKASEMNGKLQTLLKPYFLQRLKKTEFQGRLPGKKELVVFTHLSAKQRLLYEAYLEGDIVSSVLNGETASPLAAVSWLKMLCGHPSLVKEASDDYKDCDVDVLIRDSAKLQVLISLVLRLKKSGHKALIFSMSTKMLDIISKALNGSVRHLRIDGSTANNYRQKAVDHFNDRESKIDIMLLSTKAAGIGLTLTGADRAIIYDPSWNPAEDAQAIDRCYRIGQEKPVTVYRFISAGSVEEKIYEKQVHKDGIRRVVLSGSSTSTTERYFEQDELRELFKLGPRGESTMLKKFNSKINNDTTGASGKKSFLTKHSSVVGVASHDVLYSTGTLEKDPFSRQPYQLKKAKHRRSDTDVNNENVTNKDHNSLIEDLTIPYSPRFNAIPLGRNKSKATKTEKLRQNASSSSSKIVATLDEVNTLTADEHYEKAMALLLDIVEDENIALDQNDKLKTHSKISQIGNILGWL